MASEGPPRDRPERPWLPYELVCIIVSHLGASHVPRLRLVCRGWRQVAGDVVASADLVVPATMWRHKLQVVHKVLPRLRHASLLLGSASRHQRCLGCVVDTAADTLPLLGLEIRCLSSTACSCSPHLLRQPDLQAVGRISALRVLRLDGVWLSLAATFDCLQRLGALEELSVLPHNHQHHCQVQSLLAVASGLPTLRRLRFRAGPHMGPADLEPLSHLPALRRLELKQMHVESDDQLLQLCRALPSRLDVLGLELDGAFHLHRFLQDCGPLLTGRSSAQAGQSSTSATTSSSGSGSACSSAGTCSSASLSSSISTSSSTSSTTTTRGGSSDSAGAPLQQEGWAQHWLTRHAVAGKSAHGTPAFSLRLSLTAALEDPRSVELLWGMVALTHLHLNIKAQRTHPLLVLAMDALAPLLALVDLSVDNSGGGCRLLLPSLLSLAAASTPPTSPPPPTGAPSTAVASHSSPPLLTTAAPAPATPASVGEDSSANTSAGVLPPSAVTGLAILQGAWPHLRRLSLRLCQGDVLGGSRSLDATGGGGGDGDADGDGGGGGGRAPSAGTSGSHLVAELGLSSAALAALPGLHQLALAVDLVPPPGGVQVPLLQVDMSRLPRSLQRLHLTGAMLHTHAAGRSSSSCRACDDCAKASSAAMPSSPLSHLAGLADIQLTDCRASDDALRGVCQDLPHLESLQLRRVHHSLGGALFQHLGRLPPCTRLVLEPAATQAGMPAAAALGQAAGGALATESTPAVAAVTAVPPS